VTVPHPILYAAAAVLLVAIGFLLGRRSTRSDGTDLLAPAPSRRPELSGDLAADVSALMAAGKKIHAIKLYRERTGVGLKEAKDAVESGILSPPDGAEPSRGAGSTASSADLLAPGSAAPGSAAVSSQVLALKRQGKQIAAIKLVREATGWGLREAKDYVDRLPS
jgi:ribosomal protein L7/L12